MEADIQKRADKVVKDLAALEKKHGCELGVWLDWRDLLHNFEQMKINPELNELKFGIQMRINEPDNKDKKGNKKPVK